LQLFGIHARVEKEVVGFEASQLRLPRLFHSFPNVFGGFPGGGG